MYRFYNNTGYKWDNWRLYQLGPAKCLSNKVSDPPRLQSMPPFPSLKYKTHSTVPATQHSAWPAGSPVSKVPTHQKISDPLPSWIFQANRSHRIIEYSSRCFLRLTWTLKLEAFLFVMRTISLPSVITTQHWARLLPLSALSVFCAANTGSRVNIVTLWPLSSSQYYPLSWL